MKSISLEYSVQSHIIHEILHKNGITYRGRSNYWFFAKVKDVVCFVFCSSISAIVAAMIQWVIFNVSGQKICSGIPFLDSGVLEKVKKLANEYKLKHEISSTTRALELINQRRIHKEAVENQICKKVNSDQRN